VVAVFRNATTATRWRWFPER